MDSQNLRERLGLAEGDALSVSDDGSRRVIRVRRRDGGAVVSEEARGDSVKEAAANLLRQRKEVAACMAGPDR